jgi:hypothetical protein
MKSRLTPLLVTLMLAVFLALLAGRYFQRTPSRAVVPPAPPADAPPTPLPTRESNTAANQPSVPISPDLSTEHLQRTIAANLVPGRMLFLDFSLGPTSLALTGAQGAAGRAKPTPARDDPGFIRYDVFDSTGRLVIEGTVEDPTRRRIEFPASSDDGRIASTAQSAAAGTFAVRLPGESDAARIVFSRLTRGGGKSPREPLGELILRAPQP